MEDTHSLMSLGGTLDQLCFLLRKAQCSRHCVVVECCSCSLGDEIHSDKYTSFGRSAGDILCQDSGQM